MKLEDVLAVTSEYTTTKILDYGTNKVLGCYDGKDSIDTELNQCKVVYQYIDNNILYIVVLQDPDEYLEGKVRDILTKAVGSGHAETILASKGLTTPNTLLTSVVERVKHVCEHEDSYSEEKINSAIGYVLSARLGLLMKVKEES